MTRAEEDKEAWIDAVSAADVPDGGVKGVRVGGDSVAIYRVDDKLYATSDVCTHEAALLSEGWVEDGEIICPLHGARFRIEDGTCKGPLGTDLQCFRIRERAGRIEIACRTPR
jgi:nitrite reductase/ring-hydroxylating ferredoxin subunit